MTCEEYYGRENYMRLVAAQCRLEGIAKLLKDEMSATDDVRPIVYYCSRIKKPDSMKNKLKLKGLEPTVEAALRQVFDAVGLRIICSFESDVRLVVQQLENNNSFKVVQKKDYIANPKPNGYRSCHLCICMDDSAVNCEIQVRTIAMDCWATLEHQMKYKRNIENETLMKSELKRCADEIASVDLSLQTIREIIKQC